MNREQLLKKIEAVVDAAAKSRMYGKLEIEFCDGRPTFIRKLEQEKLLDSENNRAPRFK